MYKTHVTKSRQNPTLIQHYRNISVLQCSLEVHLWCTYSPISVEYAGPISLTYLYRHMSFFDLENTYMCDSRHTLSRHYCWISCNICHLNQLFIRLAWTLKESIPTAITYACLWVLSNAENGYFQVLAFWKAKFGTQYWNVLMTYSMFSVISHICTISSVNPVNFMVLAILIVKLLTVKVGHKSRNANFGAQKRLRWPHSNIHNLKNTWNIGIKFCTLPTGTFTKAYH